MPNLTNQAPDRVRRQGMLARLLATLVKVAVASLIVGTILAHFGITAEQVLKDFGITPERLAEMARQGFAWALPNLLLGSIIILPVWFVVFLFRPPGARSE
jgi:putative exporter of polyketide antibiotics